MSITKENLDAKITELVRTGLARTANELLATINKTENLKGDDILDSRHMDSAFKRLKTLGILAWNKVEKQWDALPSATATTAEVPSVNTVVKTETTSEGNTNMDTTTTNITDIDAAINAAKSKKTPPPGTTAPRVKLTEAERSARDAQAKLDREARKLQRETARATKKAELAANKAAPHMSKVDKAAEKLPKLLDASQTTFNEITVNFSRDQLAALAAHLTHFNRVKATERALAQKVNTGDKVRITGGESRFTGQEGIVSKSQRIRVYVEIAGVTKPVYLFSSDVEVIEAAAVPATGTNG